jgi:hypothetical protein
MANIVILGPHEIPPTDGMIIHGTYNLISEVHPDAVISYARWSEESDVALQLPANTTHIVIAGTPWIWDMCWNTIKWRCVLNTLKAYPQAKVLFFGIGSCLPLDHMEGIKIRLLSQKDRLKELFLRGQVIVRDQLASDILTAAEIPHTLAHCPAMHAVTELIPYIGRKTPTLFFYEPCLGVSSGSFKYNCQEHKAYIQQQVLFAKYKNADVYCITDDEVKRSNFLGIPAQKLTSVIHAKQVLARSSEVMSGRVHLAIPAISQDIKTILLPVDSRALTVSYAVTHDKDKEHQKLIKVLTEFLI